MMKVLLFLFFFGSLGCIAQNVWTLEACLDSAVQNNSEIKRIGVNTEVAQINHAQAKYDFTPSVSANAGQSYNFGRNLDPISNEFTQSNRQNSNFSLNANLVLFNGLSRYYNLSNTKLSIKNEFFNKQIAERNLKLRVLTFYLQSLLSQDLIRLSEDHLIYTLAQEKRMNILIEAENKTKVDLIEINSQKARDKLAIIKAQNDLELANQQLVRIMQLSNPKEFELDTAATLLEDTTIFVKIETLPEMQQKELQLEQAILNKKMSQGAYFPSLSMGGGLGSGYSNSYFLFDPATGENYVPNFGNQINSNLYQTVFLSLSIPIYSRHTTRTSVQLQTLAIKNSQLEQEQMAWEIVGTIEQLQIDIENARAEMNAALTLLEAAEQDFNQTELRYSKGLIAYAVLLDKQDRLYSAQSNVVQSKYNYYFKCKIISFYYE